MQEQDFQQLSAVSRRDALLVLLSDYFKKNMRLNTLLHTIKQNTGIVLEPREAEQAFNRIRALINIRRRDPQNGTQPIWAYNIADGIAASMKAGQVEQTDVTMLVKYYYVAKRSAGLARDLIMVGHGLVLPLRYISTAIEAIKEEERYWLDEKLRQDIEAQIGVDIDIDADGGGNQHECRR